MNPAKKEKLTRIKQSAVDKLPQTVITNSIVSNGKTHPSIGIYLQRMETKEPFCASDRIRGEWVASNSGNQMELFDPKKNYDVVIFHVACKAIALYGRVKILDICDRVWERNLQEFKELIKPIDAIIVPTEELKKEVSQIVPDKPVHVIQDGHDFNHYRNFVDNKHNETAKEVVWFGYAENSGCLDPFINYLKSQGLKLKVICQNRNTSTLQHADLFVKWDVKTYITEIAKSDFALLPPNKSYKSDNKDISALLCGIPVAKSKEDIARLMLPEERQLEMNKRWAELPKYAIRNRVVEYLDVVRNIKNQPLLKNNPVSVTESKANDIKVYSSIFGHIDQPRVDDFHTFKDSDADIFKFPVMNAKIYKILSHKYFNEKITIYLDGNIYLKNLPLHIVEYLLKDADMALFKHPYRNCLFQEHEHAIKRVKAPWQPLMDEQVRNYKADGMPVNFGLGECGMLIRRNNSIVNEFNERWWAEICRYTNRDQMSFPYVLWKMQGRIKVKFLEGNVRDHEYFKYINH